MKTIKEEVSLKGKFETISVSQLRQKPGEVLTLVDLGKTFLVTRNSKPIAVISSPPGETLSMTVSSKGKVGYTL
jgi:prevent-host-death family protein